MQFSSNSVALVAPVASVAATEATKVAAAIAATVAVAVELVLMETLGKIQFNEPIHNGAQEAPLNRAQRAPLREAQRALLNGAQMAPYVSDSHMPSAGARIRPI